MKALIAKFALIAVFFLGAQYVHAGLFGWVTTVNATDGTNHYSQQIATATHSACETERQDWINYYLSLGYTITSAASCTQLVLFDFDKYLVLQEEIKWPWPGPVCLSCPILTLDNIKVIYPDDFERVQGLVEKYNIEAYNKALLNLQQEFNIESFEKEMFGIELNQQLGR